MADVARRAGVSRALVSIVLRDEPGASRENRERVWRAAKELGYRPNSSARQLRRARSQHLGVVYAMTHGLDAELVEALYPAAEEAGFSLALGASTPTRTWRHAVDELLEFRCEAIIVIAPDDDPAAFTEISKAAPLIAVGRRLAGVDSIRMDDRMGSRLAVDHLVELGHRRIVHVAGDGQPGADGRRRGYLDAMAAHGLERFAHIVAGDYSEDSGADAAIAIVGSDADCSAVVTANDRMAVGLIHRLADAGVRVPGDVSVVGMDNSAQARMRHLSLTSVSQRVPALATHAVKLAIDRIDGSTAPADDVIIAPDLVVRSSTSAPPA